MDIDQKQPKTFAVIGLGYVGLPLALLFLEKGFRVIGIDVSAERVQSLMDHRSYLNEVPGDALHKAWESGRFAVSRDFEPVNAADAVVICVPTPINQYHNPDLSFLQSAALALRSHLRQGQLVVLESSTYPGTTEEVLLPLLKRDDLLVGETLFVGYSPERIDPGNRSVPLQRIPKVVSGVTKACKEKVMELYGQVFATLVPVSTPRAAEMAKLMENTQRLVNISLMNELAMVCRTLHINIWEVIDAASTKPFGFTPYYPGPGIGGHCIPVDPLYLKWKANQYGLQTQMIDVAHQINLFMPNYVVDLIADSLCATTLHAVKVLVVGVTYKKDINDVRESPAIDIIQELLFKGAIVEYSDPYVRTLRLTGQILKSVAIDPKKLPFYDVVLILTDHSNVDYEELVKNSRLVIDTRNATRNVQNKGNVSSL